MTKAASWKNAARAEEKTWRDHHGGNPADLEEGALRAGRVEVNKNDWVEWHVGYPLFRKPGDRIHVTLGYYTFSDAWDGVCEETFDREEDAVKFAVGEAATAARVLRASAARNGGSANPVEVAQEIAQIEEKRKRGRGRGTHARIPD